jgi:hypothetical protein
MIIITHRYNETTLKKEARQQKHWIQGDGYLARGDKRMA